MSSREVADESQQAFNDVASWVEGEFDGILAQAKHDAAQEAYQKAEDRLLDLGYLGASDAIELLRESEAAEFNRGKGEGDVKEP